MKRVPKYVFKAIQREHEARTAGIKAAYRDERILLDIIYADQIKQSMAREKRDLAENEQCRRELLAEIKT